MDLITSSFNHWSKSFKNMDLYKPNMWKYKTVVLNSTAYSKNVSYQRLKSHRNFAKALKQYFDGQNYDMIITVIPALEAGMATAEYCKQHAIPFLIDLNDLWPEAFKMVIKNRILYRTLTYPIKKQSDKVYTSVDGVIGTSETYTDRPFLANKKGAKKLTVYVGTDVDDFDKGAESYISKIEKPEEEFWVTYAGSLGTSYDIHTLMRAGGILARKGYDKIKFYILGDGPLRQAFEQTGKECGCNAIYLGYTKYPQMAAYLKMSDVLVNSFVRSAPQSIVNKVGDYLSAGKPMINTCSDAEMRQLVERHQFGENVIAEDDVKLADLIEKLYNNKDLCLKYSQNARKTAEVYFDRKTSYKEIVKMVNSYFV